MTGADALKQCRAACNSSMNTNDPSLYTVVSYGVGSYPGDFWTPITTPTTTVTTYSTPETEPEEGTRDDEEIQELLTTTLEWISGIGEYPAKQLAPIIGDLIEEIDAEEHYALLEKTVARTLSWVLGRIGADVIPEE